MLPSLHGVSSASGVVWQPATASHESTVHGSPSSQKTAVWTQPPAASQLSFVQTLWSSQRSGVPGTQMPAWHVSTPLQTLLSPHAVPSLSVRCWHAASGLQESVVHGLLSLQSIGKPPWQRPATHVSPCVQAFASSQPVPSGDTVPAVHVPFWQVSPTVQPLPSSHVAPFGFAGLEHAPVSML